MYSVQFGKFIEHSNLFTFIAIDFLLNPSYATTDLALKCRFRNIPEMNNTSYVILHILSDKQFQFNVRLTFYLTFLS